MTKMAAAVLAAQLSLAQSGLKITKRVLKKYFQVVNHVLVTQASDDITITAKSDRQIVPCSNPMTMPLEKLANQV